MDDSLPSDSKSYRILCLIRDRDGMRLTDIQRELWYMDPENSGTMFCRLLRGYWCTNLLGGKFYHGGLLRTFCEKREDGKWHYVGTDPVPRKPWRRMREIEEQQVAQGLRLSYPAIGNAGRWMWSAA